MFNLMLIFTMAMSCAEAIKEHCTPAIPAENWANKELIRQDISNNVSAKQRIKNAQNGKYKLTEKYSEPHRDPITGKIVIENCKLYYADRKDYDVFQVDKWVKQGKYNLSPEEFKKEKERIKEEVRKEMESLYNL